MVIIGSKLGRAAYFVEDIAYIVEVQYLGGFHLHPKKLHFKLKRTHCRFFLLNV